MKKNPDCGKVLKLADAITLDSWKPQESDRMHACPVGFDNFTTPRVASICSLMALPIVHPPSQLV
ncbi:hypothetical protein [Synechococcus sp. M16CYN]|uniref:hypothetical protein n=1 Tax=Synechococcus sp. M16CYN TaxID=3103139 RepID=UPI0033419CA6